MEIGMEKGPTSPTNSPVRPKAELIHRSMGILPMTREAEIEIGMEKGSTSPTNSPIRPCREEVFGAGKIPVKDTGRMPVLLGQMPPATFAEQPRRSGRGEESGPRTGEPPLFNGRMVRFAHHDKSQRRFKRVSKKAPRHKRRSPSC